MFSVAVLYPNTEGAKFDLDYYTATHLPLVRRLLDPLGLRRLTYVEPITPGGPSPYRLVAQLHFDDADSAKKALSENGAETQADIPNFTDIKPIFLMGEVHEA